MGEGLLALFALLAQLPQSVSKGFIGRLIGAGLVGQFDSLKVIIWAG